MDPKEKNVNTGATARRGARILPRDVHIAFMLFTVAALFGTAYTVIWSGAPRGHYTFWIRPAIGLAAGGGLVSPKDDAIPGLTEFLAKQTDRIEPGVIPREYPNSPANDIQITHLYLIAATAAFWMLFGISWGALAPLHGIVFGLTAVFAYGLFRLGMNRVFALVCTCLFVLSPGHLVILPHLRDYGKAPFILAALLAMGVLLKRPLGWAKTLGIAVLLGVAIGLGLGVRQDVQVLVIPAVVILLVFLPGALRRTWLLRITATATMLAAFTLSAWPVLVAMQRGGAYPAHNIMNGFSNNSHKLLGVGDAPYEWNYAFSDTYVATRIGDYARNRLHVETPPAYLRPDYDAAGRKLILEMIFTFPADMILRGIVAMRRIIEESPIFYGEPDFQSNPFIDNVSLRLGPALFWAAKWSGILAILVVVALSLFSFRIALASVFLLLCLGFYPTLQFHFRHFFHLGFLTWWFPGVAFNALLMAVVSLRRRDGRRAVYGAFRAPGTLWPQRLRPCAAFVLLVAVGVGLPWFAARFIQERQVGRLLEDVASRKLIPLECGVLEAGAAGGNLRLFQPKNLFDSGFSAEDKRWQSRRAMVAVELRGNDKAAPLRFVYDSQVPGERWDYDVTVQLPAAGGAKVTRFYFPVFELPSGTRVGSSYIGWRTFKGVVVPESMQPLIAGVYKVEQPETLPLAMCYRLHDDWRTNAKRHLSVVPRRLPGPMRIVSASWTNELGNGGFELWDAARNAPANAQPPKTHSAIQPESAIVARGRQALKQVWTSNDAAATALDLFGVWVQGLEPGVFYDLVVEANNPSDANFKISAWQVSAVQGQAPRVNLGILRMLVVEKTRGYQTFIGTFCVPENVSPDAWWLFSTSCLDSNTTSATVYWDSWRLGRVVER